MIKIINKILSLYVLLRHGYIQKEYRYYYRHSYYCRLIQLKYFVNDYIIKKPYKVIRFGGEFAPDIMYALPFAYWHYKNGTLKATTGAKHTSELYFFSPHHEELFESRTPKNNYNFEVPNVVYSHDYYFKKWEPVPLKEKYKNSTYIFDKPIIIIANRYNSEWDGPPISYFSIPVLSKMIDLLISDYTVIYNRPKATQIATDNSEIYELHEFEWLKAQYPKVILMEDLYKENKVNAKNYNHLQMLVYANAEYFISIHGGTASFASYFGGINLIYSVKGPEHYFGCFQKLFPKLSGAQIIHVKSEPELFEQITKAFTKSKP